MHLFGNDDIYRAHVAHAYRRRISEELCGCFFVNVAAIILSYEQKTHFRCIWGCFGYISVDNWRFFSADIQFWIMSTFGPILLSSVSLDDVLVIPPKMSHNPLQTGPD